MADFERKYSRIDKTSSKYRDRVMVEVGPIREELDEFIKATSLKEATAIRLATITGLRIFRNHVGLEELEYLCDEKRSRN